MRVRRTLVRDRRGRGRAPDVRMPRLLRRPAVLLRALNCVHHGHTIVPLRQRALRRVHGAARVPTGLLTRQQAWSLAHAADFVATTADEMVDPWD